MTDHLDRVFVAVAFKGGDEVVEKVTQELNDRLDGFGHSYEIMAHKPPAIFTPEELENRFVDLYMAAQEYLEKYTKKFGVKLQLDPRLLYIATISAFDDIARYKAYHLERPYFERSDAVKRSAYLTKWLTKIGAFQTRFDLEDIGLEEVLKPENLRATTALANISFAIKVSLIHLTLECRRNKVALSPDAEFQLSYDLLFRRVNEDALLSKFQKVMDFALGNDVVITD